MKLSGKKKKREKRMLNTNVTHKYEKCKEKERREN